MTKRKWLVCLLALVATLCITFSAIGCGEKQKKNKPAEDEEVIMPIEAEPVERVRKKVNIDIAVDD